MVFRGGVRSILLLTALCVVACDRDETASDAGEAAAASASALVLEAEPEDEVDGGVTQKRGEARKADERVTIPAGKFTAGSTPGDRGRDPVLEAAVLEVELSGFEIDRLPYPNDPFQPPLTNVTRKGAEELCAAREGRLCSELEWERACKGPDQTAYSGAVRWDPQCAKAPQTCASGFDTLAMGAAMREWSSSDVEAIKKLQPRAAAVRGAGDSAADVDHRCAHRTAVDADSKAADLGFRCCYGATNEVVIRSPDWLGTFRKTTFASTRLQQMFGSIPRLQSLAAEEPKYFREDSAAATVKQLGEKRGYDAGALDENEYMTSLPLLWNPVPGEEILLVTGRSGKDSFIVAFHKLPDDRYRVGAAMVLEGEFGPVAFVYNPFVRRKLHWTTCWQCYGEVGNITYRQENRVAITQQ